ARELPRILELVDPPALLDQGIDAGRGEDSNGLVAELLLELRVAQRALQVTERFLDEELQHTPVVELDLDVDLVLADRGVRRRGRDRAQAREDRVVQRLVGELGEPALAARETDRRGVIDRVLRLQRAPQILVIAEVEHERRDAQPHRLDRRGVRPVALAYPAAAVDRRVHDEAARDRKSTRLKSSHVKS